MDVLLKLTLFPDIKGSISESYVNLIPSEHVLMVKCFDVQSQEIG